MTEDKKKTGFCDCEVCQEHRGGVPGDPTKEQIEQFFDSGWKQVDINNDNQCHECDYWGIDPESDPCQECEDGSMYQSGDHPVDVDEIVRGKALKKALEIINGERQDSYGNPEDSFKLIAKYWNAYLIELQKAVLVMHGFDPADYDLVDMLDGRHVAEMMSLFKIARMSGQKTTADNYSDAAGYIGLAGDMV